MSLDTANRVASTTFGYDQADRVTDIVHYTGTLDGQSPLSDYGLLGLGGDAGLLAFYHLAYRADGRIDRIDSADGRASYGYDSAGQLTSAAYTVIAGRTAPANEDYKYDPTGNRVVPDSAPSSTPPIITGPHNRLTNDGTYSYQYDAQGNRTGRTTLAGNDAGATEIYDWNAAGRLEKVHQRASSSPTAADVKTIDYVYDMLGRRVAKLIDEDGAGPGHARAEYFAWDDVGSDIVLELTDSDVTDTIAPAVARRNLWGPGSDELLAVETTAGQASSATQTRWTLADHLGSNRDLVTYDSQTNTTSVSHHFVIDSFGTLVATTDGSGAALTSPAPFRYLWAGQELDPETGLTYMDARYYDSFTHQFISPDFITDDIQNTYRYVGNDPVNATDPQGLAEVLFDGKTFVGRRSKPWDKKSDLDDAEELARRYTNAFSFALSDDFTFKGPMKTVVLANHIEKVGMNGTLQKGLGTVDIRFSLEFMVELNLAKDFLAHRKAIEDNMPRIGAGPPPPTTPWEIEERDRIDKQIRTYALLRDLDWAQDRAQRGNPNARRIRMELSQLLGRASGVFTIEDYQGMTDMFAPCFGPVGVPPLVVNGGVYLLYGEEEHALHSFGQAFIVVVVEAPLRFGKVPVPGGTPVARGEISVAELVPRRSPDYYGAFAEFLDAPYYEGAASSRVAARTNAPNRIPAPQTGSLFERTFQTSKGPVGFLAEVEISGKTLHLKDVVIYGEGSTPLTGLTKEVLAARTQLISDARAMGFERLRITGQRVASSSSANPGHFIDVIIDLTK